MTSSNFKGLVWALFSLFAQVAFAVPAVTSSGTWSTQGGNVQIFGSGFGTKTTPGPQLYDNFDQVPTTTIASTTFGSSPWLAQGVFAGYTYDYGGGGAYTSHSYIRSSVGGLPGSTYHAQTTFNDVGSWAQFLSFNYTGSSVYISFYYKIIQIGTAFPRQSKAIIWYLGDTDIRYFSTAYDAEGGITAPCGEGGGYRQHVSGIQDQQMATTGFKCWNKWCRFENYVVNSSSSTGKWHSFIHLEDGTVDAAVRNNQTTQTLGTPNQITIGGAYYDQCGNQSGSVNVDKIVIDTTPSRVELCAGSTWTNRGNCDYQIATSWQTGNITVQSDRSRFTDGQTAYVYVCDSTDVCNANGFAVTIGSGGGNPPIVDSVSCTPTIVQSVGTTTCTGTLSGGTPTSYSWSASSCTTAQCSSASNSNPGTYTCQFGGACTLCLTATNVDGSSSPTCASPIAVRYRKPTSITVH